MSRPRSKRKPGLRRGKQLKPPGGTVKIRERGTKSCITKNPKPIVKQ
jgi:hypothetical protein